MDNFKGVLSELSKNLKAQILIFGVLIVIVVAVFGGTLQNTARTLIYVVVIGVMAIYLVERFINAWVSVKKSALGEQPKPDNEQAKPGTPPASLPQDRIPPTSGETKPQVVSIEALRIAYLERITADCHRARLAGLDPKAADPTRRAMELDKLYITLDTTTQVKLKIKKAKQGDSQLREETRPLPVLEALFQADEQRMVLLGLPGSGKSTFVRYLALEHARALLNSELDITKELPGWKGKPAIPVIIPLGLLAESLPVGAQRGHADLICKFLATTLSSDELIRPYADYLLSDLKKNGGLFLFDGLDEVADLNLRPVIVRAVEDFVEKYVKNHLSRFLVTCRTFSYNDPEWQLTGWQEYQLAAFTQPKINQFIDCWYNEWKRIDRARESDYERKRKNLSDTLAPNDWRHLAEIADNPLMLTVMAVVHTYEGELPDARALVYEKCIDLLLLRWEAERQVLGGKSQRQSLLDALQVNKKALELALQEIAYNAHASEVGAGRERGAAARVVEDIMLGPLSAYLREQEKVDIFLDYCRTANGLLLFQGTARLPNAPSDSPPRRVYTFPHRTFQEYLAARHLGRKSDPEEVRQHLDKGDHWREVIIFLGEHLCFRDDKDYLVESILKALAPEPLPAAMQEADWKALWTAGEWSILFQRAYGKEPQSAEHIRKGLVSLLEQGQLSARERSAAGNALASLGDPRFDPQAYFLPREPRLGFLEVPSGLFIMGSDPAKDKQADKDEQPQHEVDLPLFYIARYPVTNAQFDSFTKDGGYGERRFWHQAIQDKTWKDGKVLRRVYKIDKPEIVEEFADKPVDFGAPYNLPNHPVVGICWYEALAYCHWLTEKLCAMAQVVKTVEERSFWEGFVQAKLVINLPSEAEWEKAARGIDGRIYPWSGDFDPDQANIDETGLNATSPVGCFPKGASPYGALDMSGNVWEWTRGLWGDQSGYPYRPGKEREHLGAGRDVARVLRGGSCFLYRRIRPLRFPLQAPSRSPGPAMWVFG
jgi:formylglycine-generating enzyme required for sulfatase activity